MPDAKNSLTCRTARGTPPTCPDLPRPLRLLERSVWPMLRRAGWSVARCSKPGHHVGGTRPRLLTRMPCAAAHARTAAGSAAVSTRVTAGRIDGRPVPMLCRPALTNGASPDRNLAAFLVDRSISYSVPSRPKVTVSRRRDEGPGHPSHRSARALLAGSSGVVLAVSPWPPTTLPPALARNARPGRPARGTPDPCDCWRIGLADGWKREVSLSTPRVDASRPARLPIGNSVRPTSGSTGDAAAGVRGVAGGEPARGQFRSSSATCTAASSALAPAPSMPTSLPFISESTSSPLPSLGSTSRPARAVLTSPS
jgi:hypothetical protein